MYRDIFEPTSFYFRLQTFLRSHVVYSKRIEFACPHISRMVSGFTLEKLTRPAPCVSILVYCSVGDWTRFCSVIGFENIQIHRPNVMQIDFFSSLESGLRRLERVFSCTRARKHTRQLNDSKLAHRKLNLA